MKTNQIKPITELLGKTFTKVEANAATVVFELADGGRYLLAHYQACCESVGLNDICGDLANLVGSPILQAEEVISGEAPQGAKAPEYVEVSETWTLYKFATINGYVTLRWYGTSNGYYSEGVDLFYCPASERVH